jgi:4-hydroxy-3-polyprenylbenzoate decarboxylase
MVDDDTNVQEADDVFWTLLNNIDPERDTRILEGTTGPVMVLDGTRKLPEEGFTRQWPDKIVMDADISRLVDEKWPRYGIPGLPLKSPTVKPTRDLMEH